MIDPMSVTSLVHALQTTYGQGPMNISSLARPITNEEHGGPPRLVSLTRKLNAVSIKWAIPRSGDRRWRPAVGFLQGRRKDRERTAKGG
jgi:hypothetical protein